MFDPPSDNFDELRQPARPYLEDSHGPCKPHEAATNHAHLPNWKELFPDWRRILGML